MVEAQKKLIATATTVRWSRQYITEGSKTDRKSTRLNSSHSQISYAVFCLKKKKLDHAVETTTLDNVLAVTTVSFPHLHTAVCSLLVKVGALVELPDDNGLSHCIEHMLSRS